MSSILDNPLLLKAMVLLVGMGAGSAYSWISGKSILVYKVVSKVDQPVAYWTATIIVTACAFICLIVVVRLGLQGPA